MKKMFTLLMSLMVFSALFAQYNKPYDNRKYDNHNAPYNNGGYSNNNGNYNYQQPGAERHDDGYFQTPERRDGNNRREDFGDHRDSYHPDHDRDFGYRDRGDWRRNHHRGLGVLGTGLLIGGVLGVMVAAHN